MSGESWDDAAWAPPTSGAGATPALLPGYRDFEQIARGGDSVVYRAHQDALDRDVAIKVVQLDDDESIARFRRELAITVQLGRQHPNIMTVLATGTTSSGQPCLVMDHYELGSLHDRILAQGPLSVSEVVAAGSVVADALAFAHGQGVLHRDVKPQNVMVLPTSYVLADFGLARAIDAGHSSSLERFSYRHASPQILDGDAPTVADDVYSLGSTLFTLLDGRAPFAAADPDEDSALSYLLRARTERPRALDRDDVPPQLLDVVDRCLARDRTVRFPDAATLRDALDAVPTETRSWAPTSRPPERPAPEEDAGGDPDAAFAPPPAALPEPAVEPEPAPAAAAVGTGPETDGAEPDAVDPEPDAVEADLDAVDPGTATEPAEVTSFAPPAATPAPTPAAPRTPLLSADPPPAEPPLRDEPARSALARLATPTAADDDATGLRPAEPPDDVPADPADTRGGGRRRTLVVAAAAVVALVLGIGIGIWRGSSGGSSAGPQPSPTTDTTSSSATPTPTPNTTPTPTATTPTATAPVVYAADPRIKTYTRSSSVSVGLTWSDPTQGRYDFLIVDLENPPAFDAQSAVGPAATVPLLPGRHCIRVALVIPTGVGDHRFQFGPTLCKTT